MNVLHDEDYKTIILEIRDTPGPNRLSKYYKFLEDTRVSIVQKKWEGVVEQSGDLSSWVNKYSEIDLGEVQIKKNTILDIKDKFKYIHPKPLILKMSSGKEYSINDIGNSLDKYHITLPTNSKYSIETSEYRYR